MLARAAVVSLVMSGLVWSGLVLSDGVSARAADDPADHGPATGTALAIDASHLEIAGRRFKLYGIDAPDVDQTCADAKGQDYPCGIEARAALAALVKDASVTCQPLGPNQRNEMLAHCTVGEINVARALIDAGWAIADRARTLNYEAPELVARAAKRGIWQGRFVPPGDWRAGERVPQTRPYEKTTP
jgi:endonuclease YncB( thermonuclease family)